MLYCRLTVVFVLVFGNPFPEWGRVKREFMFVSDTNSTDPGCFQNCTNQWKSDFESTFTLKISDYYDFPFHPLILHYPNYLKYCDLAEKQTKCFIDDCDDDTAERVFSPSNFVCHFKRQQFLTVRSCLEETEPITFLKCDQYCHTKALDFVKSEARATIGEVFVKPELSRYQRELDLLCTFQECFRNCHEPVVNEMCAPALAVASTELIQAYIQLHAIDIYDWHLMSDNMVSLPDSCARLTANTRQLEEDPVVKIINSDKE
ncbi:hypothetical protein L596_009328 [Steinernema carpocapsae]|uniref:Chondroitin proteoglycan 4 domain-containing protein n=1 Tax=Steinernema carpocapsae TaxID=34508 RepID=A0A4U5PFF9_STECR|nr:hypothetical protein L596_009328 [Steinernema carpocapsae]